MPLRGLSVLVVEDDRAHRELAQDMLTALGAHVTSATTSRVSNSSSTTKTTGRMQRNDRTTDARLRAAQCDRGAIPEAM
jgi:CheY-like chemotaxis protein